jgi:hypothetical protein
MSVTNGPVDVVKPTTRIRLVLLKVLIDRANDSYALRKWIFELASRDLCRIYWPIEWRLCAFSGPGENVEPFDGPMTTRVSMLETNPNNWIPRPEVKFVRIASHLAEQFSDRRRVPISLFPDGLFLSDDVTGTSKLLEATAFTARIRVSLHTQPAPVAETNGISDQDLRNAVEVDFNELHVEESVGGYISDHFVDILDTANTPSKHATGKNQAQNSIATKAAIEAVKSSFAITDVASEAPETSVIEAPDPYGLKGRSGGVYVLYQTAERCAGNAAFASAAKAQERIGIALKTFSEIMDERASAGREENKRQEKLRQFLSKTRLNSARRLIDPHYLYNNGRTLKQQGEWPPAAGQTFLAQQDIRRQTFVTDMLRLMIGGVERWHDLDLSDFPKDTTRQEVLRHWLEKHGVAGTGVLKTAFEVITWNGGGVPALPKYDKLSTSRDPRGEERRA